MVGGTRPDGMTVTNRRTLSVPLAAPGNRVVYSTDGGRTWKQTWNATEGVNEVLVSQVNPRGQRSAPQPLRFVLDTKAPAAPRLALLDGIGGVSRSGRLHAARVEQNARIEYSLNGGGWTSNYAPAEGRNVVRVRQIDLAGNISRPSDRLVFTRKTAVNPVVVSLRRDTGPDKGDRITWDGRLPLRGLEPGATTQYSTDDGATWKVRFTPVLGENRVMVRQIDRVGNLSPPTAFSFTLIRRPGSLRALASLLGRPR